MADKVFGNWLSSEIPVNLTNLTTSDFDDVIDQSADLMQSFVTKVILFVCYSAIFSIGCVSNIAMLVVGIRHQISDLRVNPTRRHGKDAGRMQAFSVTNVMVTNLAAADIFLCAFSLFFTPISFYVADWPFGEFGCKLLPSTSVVSVCVISFTSTVIAVDRLLAICYPHSTRLTLRSACFCLVVIWLVSFGCSLPLMYHSEVTFYAKLEVTIHHPP